MKCLTKQRHSRIALAIYLLCTTLLLFGCSSGVAANRGSTADAAAKTASVRAGAPAPDFTLQTFSGHSFKLSDQRGKKVFLNFWASWCGPCKDEMPALQKMARQYVGQVDVYGVNMTSDDTMERANSFLFEQGVTFPNLIDDKGTVKNSYCIFSYPVSITIDENGTLVDRHDGELTPDQMKQMFQNLVKKTRF